MPDLSYILGFIDHLSDFMGDHRSFDDDSVSFYQKKSISQNANSIMFKKHFINRNQYDVSKENLLQNSNNMMSVCL